MGAQKFGTIHVRRGNRSEDLADKFVRDHGLPSEVLPHLIQQIRNSVSALAAPSRRPSTDDSTSDDGTSSSSDEGDSVVRGSQRPAEEPAVQHANAQPGGQPSAPQQMPRSPSDAGVESSSRPAQSQSPPAARAHAHGDPAGPSAHREHAPSTRRGTAQRGHAAAASEGSEPSAQVDRGLVARQSSSRVPFLERAQSAEDSPRRAPSSSEERFSGLSPPGRSHSFSAVVPAPGGGGEGGGGEVLAPLALVFGTPKVRLSRRSTNPLWSRY